MRTTTALLLLLALALPAVAMPHPCEAEVAQMKKDLDAIRDAVATIEGLRPSDNQRLVLAGAKDKYDLELRRMTAAQARCERLGRRAGRHASATSGRQAVRHGHSAVPAPAPAAPAGRPGRGDPRPPAAPLRRPRRPPVGDAGNPVPDRLRQGHRLQG